MTQVVLGRNGFDISMISAMTEYNENTLTKPGIYVCWVVFPDGSVWVYVGSSYSRDRVAAPIRKAYDRPPQYSKAGRKYHHIACSSFIRIFAKAAATQRIAGFVRPLLIFEHGSNEKERHQLTPELALFESIFILDFESVTPEQKICVIPNLNLEFEDASLLCFVLLLG
ncbi:hypothetical protein LTR95_013099 [Oleoguttula sp. CCFEE 5521]